MDEARHQVIRDAIATLKPEDFTKSGLPGLPALKAIIPDITAEERDQVWNDVKPVEETSSDDTKKESKQKPEIVRGEDVIKTLREKGHRV